MISWNQFPAATVQQDAGEWDELANTMIGAPFLRSTFLRPLLREFASGNETLAICRDGDYPKIAAILAPKGIGRWETFQPSQLPLGALVAAPDVKLEEALEGLCRSLPGICGLVGITQQDPHFLDRPQGSSSIQTMDYVQTAWVDVNGPFDDYWAARGKNLRNNMRKQRKKLLEDQVSGRLEVITSPSAIAGAIRDFGVLESAGWKSATGTAIHPDNAQGRFYRTALEAFCTEGRGRVYRYLLDDQVVAMDLCIEGDDTLVILKTTYDESLKSLSPAFLMREEAFRQIYAEGRIRRIEFYGKLMEWHTRWTENVRTLYHINYFRWSWLSRLRSAIGKLRLASPPKGDA